MNRLSVHDLGAYLREQRQNAQLSVRQLAELAGVSNPYLSQIERGLKKPSAEILQQLAHGLKVSAESLYVRAGILDDHLRTHPHAPGVMEAIAADPFLSDRQRGVLVDVYTSFVPESVRAAAEATTAPAAGVADAAAQTPAGAGEPTAVDAAPSTRSAHSTRSTPEVPTARAASAKRPAPRTRSPRPRKAPDTGGRSAVRVVPRKSVPRKVADPSSTGTTNETS